MTPTARRQHQTALQADRAPKSQGRARLREQALRSVTSLRLEPVIAQVLNPD